MSTAIVNHPDGKLHLIEEMSESQRPASVHEPIISGEIVVERMMRSCERVMGNSFLTDDNKAKRATASSKAI